MDTRLLYTPSRRKLPRRYRLPITEPPCGTTGASGLPGAHFRLVERVRLAPDREWIESYFNLLEEMIDFAGLDASDPRLVLSIPRSRALPVTINLRYVLSPFRKGEPLLGFILGPEVVDTTEPKPSLEPSRSFREGGTVRLRDGATLAFRHQPWRFRPWGVEQPEETPSFFRVPGRPGTILTGSLKDYWKEAVMREVEHGQRSPFRRYHEPLVYRAAVDRAYRDRVLDEAFGSRPS